MGSMMLLMELAVTVPVPPNQSAMPLPEGPGVFPPIVLPLIVALAPRPFTSIPLA